MFKTSDCDTKARNVLWSVGSDINDLKLSLTLGTFRPVSSPIFENKNILKASATSCLSPTWVLFITKLFDSPDMSLCFPIILLRVLQGF